MFLSMIQQRNQRTQIGIVHLAFADTARHTGRLTGVILEAAGLAVSAHRTTHLVGVSNAKQNERSRTGF